MRPTVDDDFDGYWLGTVNVVQNQNDALNFALKSTSEKVHDSYEVVMRGIRDRKVQDYYVEKCMRPYTTSPSTCVYDNNKDTERVNKTKTSTKLQKRGWLLSCMRPQVKFS